MIKEYDSREKTPQLIFLGLDESDANGLKYKNFGGAPHFALDITPTAPYEEAANGVIAELEKKGLSFVEGMRAMNFPADVGEFMFSLLPYRLRRLRISKPPCMPWHAHF